MSSYELLINSPADLVSFAVSMKLSFPSVETIKVCTEAMYESALLIRSS